LKLLLKLAQSYEKQAKLLQELSELLLIKEMRPHIFDNGSDVIFGGLKREDGFVEAHFLNIKSQKKEQLTQSELLRFRPDAEISGYWREKDNEVLQIPKSLSKKRKSTCNNP